MKNKILFVFVFIIPLFLYSCGNKDIENTNNDQNTSVSEEKTVTSLVEGDKILIAYVKNIKGVVINTLINDKLEVGDILYIGDIIETNSDSEITMVMSDHSIFRLNSDSEFIFESIEGNNTNINLVKGSLWGRILKSISSEEVINISNNGVTAAIIGTSVLYEAGKDASKKPKISVIDSFSDTAGKEGVKITDNTNNINKEYTVLPEQYMDLNKIPRVLSMSKVYKLSPQIIDNSKKDLIYMTQIFEENSNLSDGTSKKIIGEINKTIPEKSEVNDFFDNKEIADSTSSGINNISELLIKDEIISNLKVEMTNIGIKKQDSIDFIDDIVQQDYASQGLDLNDIMLKYNDDMKDLSKKIEKDYSVDLNIANISKTELLQLAKQNLEEVNKAAEELMHFTDIQVSQLRLMGIKIEGNYNQKILDLESSTEEKISNIDSETDRQISYLELSTEENIKNIENNSEQEIIKVENEIAVKIKIVEKQIQSQISKLEQEYDDKILVLKSSIDLLEDEDYDKENQLEEQIDILESEKDEQIELLEEKLSKIIDDLELERDIRIESIENKRDNAIMAIEDKADINIDTYDNQRYTNIDDLEDKTDYEINDLENKKDGELDFIDNSIDKIIDEAEEKTENAIDKAEDYLDDVEYMDY